MISLKSSLSPYEILPFIHLLAFVLGFSALQSNRIARLEIAPTSVTLAPGETLQMEVTARTRSGKTVPAEDLDITEVGWRIQEDDGSFSVDKNGLITAISEGSSGSVLAYAKKGRTYSNPVPVTVTANP